ncbi:cupin domain-containing protein [Hyphomicrobium sp. 99]|uniref:cupin domain-containing protein n=1 Tax=Hyphomicrobium sp. 99 TaxID=1163419 RepID=UPI0005F77D2A|nr:cupin domain-containing protein [Hyphomicrobium sp. 99]
MEQTSVKYGKGFRVIAGNSRSQAAVMVIEPGGREGGKDNFHKDSDQWLYVESGTGEAIVDGHTHALRPGSLILIAHGERHEIRNTGNDPMKTLNFYVPPAYTRDGAERPAGKAE